MAETARSRIAYSVFAGTLFAVLVFSYFFFWTAAIAWLGAILFLWIVFRRGDLNRVLITGGIIGIFAIASIVPFVILLSHRNRNMDEIHHLRLSHAPDPFYLPEIIGFIVLGIIGFAWRRNLIKIGSPLVLFAASCALMLVVVFNQQIITGQSLQPIHYKSFIGNYMALLSVVLLFSILWRARNPDRAIPKRLLAMATLVCLGWGIVEVSDITSRDAAVARLRDEILPVSRRLNNMVRDDGSFAAARAGKAPYPVVYVSTLDAVRSIGTASPLAVLWTLHTPACGVSLTESKERFYQYMYYSGLTPQEIGTGMLQARFIVLAPLFGPERIVEGLISDPKPITTDEMAEELRHYIEYAEHFSIAQATHPQLNFVVVPNGEAKPSLNNLDKWYERDAGEQVGLFTIYRVKLRPAPPG
ncbi:MAG: hypothetical protein DMF76_01985 [Acidobacteria bacterium]|nr:MAG: hypothetical protein DMF76_01985 [Acidobacteriota bacterium]